MERGRRSQDNAARREGAKSTRGGHLENGGKRRGGGQKIKIYIYYYIFWAGNRKRNGKLVGYGRIFLSLVPPSNSTPTTIPPSLQLLHLSTFFLLYSSISLPPSLYSISTPSLFLPLSSSNSLLHLYFLFHLYSISTPHLYYSSISLPSSFSTPPSLLLHLSTPSLLPLSSSISLLPTLYSISTPSLLIVHIY